MELSRFEIVATLFAYAENGLGTSHALIELDRSGKTVTPATALTNGTGVNQANVVFEKDSASLSSGVSLELSLGSGNGFTITETGLNLLGESWVMAEVVALLIINDATSAGDLLVGGASSAQFDAWLNNNATAKIRIRPGGFFCIFAPTDPAYTCAAGDTLLKLEATGGDVTYQIYGMGRNA